MMFSNLGFQRQLSIAFGAGIFILALVTTLVVSRVSTQALQERIIVEGTQLALELAERSTLALLYESEQTAEEAVGILDTFKDVVSVQVLSREMKPLYSRGKPMEANMASSVNLVNNVIVADEKLHWHFIATVKVKRLDNEPIHTLSIVPEDVLGFVRVVMSKESLKSMAINILLLNFLISFGIAFVLLVVLLVISQRVLGPINYLAKVMSSAQQGEVESHVTIRGPRDIQQMFIAFNTMMDILKQRELELEKSRDDAYELATLKGEFAANVSHELRTPMNGVLGMLEMLGDSSLTGKEREYLNVAKNSAKSLLQLINDILDFSKNEAGKTILEEEDFDLFDHVEEVVALLGTQTQKKKIDLTYSILGDLPRCFKGDVNRIRQLLINLTNNAIKFTDRGTVSIDLTKRDEGSGDSAMVKLRFTISDTGIGIPQDKQEHIFSAFSQADGKTTRRYGGTGLGLSICKQLVELMQGEIGVKSTPGNGSVFWFDLPLCQSETVLGKTFNSTRATLKVLVVDSNPAVRHSIEWMLKRSGNHCQQAGSHSNAVKLIHSAEQDNSPFDLIIIDKQLDDSAQTPIAEQLRATNSTPFCALMTFSIDQPLIENENSTILVKPIINSHLNAILDRVSRKNQKTEKDIPGKVEKIQANNEPVFPEAKILIVDDNPVNQMVAVGLLEPLRCKTATAVHGLECLEKLEVEHFDLILMDCNMPELDGYKASEAIRARNDEKKNVIIIAITANAGPGERDKCLNSGMNDYLVKPFDRLGLKDKFLQWLPEFKRKP
ncbi:Signal transduction histidine kinase [Alteromonadaceae bacterium Bs31]|nr:Signal transduction histidine kinase [Alteromonadaceae bacterium Bs31]